MFNDVIEKYIDGKNIFKIDNSYFMCNDYWFTGRGVIWDSNKSNNAIYITAWTKFISNNEEQAMRVSDHHCMIEDLYFIRIFKNFVNSTEYDTLFRMNIHVKDVDELLEYIILKNSEVSQFRNSYCLR